MIQFLIILNMQNLMQLTKKSIMRQNFLCVKLLLIILMMVLKQKLAKTELDFQVEKSKDYLSLGHFLKIVK